MFDHIDLILVLLAVIDDLHRFENFAPQTLIEGGWQDLDVLNKKLGSMFFMTKSLSNIFMFQRH